MTLPYLGRRIVFILLLVFFTVTMVTVTVNMATVTSKVREKLSCGPVFNEIFMRKETKTIYSLQLTQSNCASSVKSKV